MDHIIGVAARAMALLGGAALLALIVLICVSVTGRGLNTAAHSGDINALGTWLLAHGVGPILGDFEVVEAGIAFAIFAFLPLTQLTRNHARVDLFTLRLGATANRWIAAFWDIVMAVVIVLITWRLFVGMQDKMRYGETTFLIQFPIWWAYAASLFAALVACLVALYCAILACIGKRHAR